MEHCGGGDLYTKIATSKDKRFSEPVAREVFKKLLGAVNHCHINNILHRDLKPENIMFSTEFSDLDKPTELKIIDFGLGKQFDKDSNISGVVGTSYYVAPEVLERKTYGASCDCWSLGVILYVILSGHLPFPGRKHKEVFAKIK
jgi:serine/threonine protein kinase